MELKLYNTLTRTKEAFRPLDPARVRMYVCGPTVYDFAHIGNARPLIVFDVLYRLLRHLYGPDHVKYVRNVTDVDDKINARAAERGISIRELTEETYKNFKEDVAALGCLSPSVEPRATEHVEEMKVLIERLVAANFAYVAEDHVLFHVASMPDYGKLAHRSTDEMMAGARVEVAPYKRDPMDFVLWKPSKPGEPAWPSPCGIAAPGRPGWHIECSAMSWKHLGETFDIHGGGIDLVFPHHENELAQSRCAFHTPIMAQVWMHNGYLQAEGEKMSKSLGNFLTIRQLLHQWHGEVLRFQMLSTHYRQPIDWLASRSSDAENELWEWSTTLVQSEAETDGYIRAVRKERPDPSPSLVEALSDDLNTPETLAVLRAEYKQARDGGSDQKIQFLKDCEFVGLLRHNKLWVHLSGVTSIGAAFIAGQYADEVRSIRISIANNLTSFRDELVSKLQSQGVGVETDEDGGVTLVPLSDAVKYQETRIATMIANRNAAREAKNFKEADRIRDELAKMGVVLKDNKNGTTSWEVAR
jgi:cysteinyl-tRNA synthetase